MILTCNFEELLALTTGAELLLSGREVGAHGAVAAPAEVFAHVEMLRPRLASALTIDTLDEQRSVQMAVQAICDQLRERMDETVFELHPAHEEAVALYFDYAHTYSVLRRLEEMGRQMSGLIELITGDEPTDVGAREIEFPD
ncbi:MAG TPA: hypothetical protein VMN39_10550 [Longimicrobiaceae bacterium]|nr:hypothetical protein [Longimicrobiaceae bacterium]